MTTILHVSDLHFGRPAVLEHIDALEAAFARGHCDVIAFSGDFSQRTRSGEFQRAAVLLREAKKYSEVICVPGNHDVAWWQAPLGIGDTTRLYEQYKRYISHDLEPTLQVPGAFFVGINTSHGITPRTLTWNARDLSILGDVTPQQLAIAQTRLASASNGDVKVVVMHHNPVKGELSRRFGFKHSTQLLDTLGDMGVDLVLCGHDHQEAVTLVEREPNGIVVSTAGTVSNRSRGGRPSSYNLITTTAESIQVVTHIWAPDAHDFLPGPTYNFARSTHAHTD